jgi:hypothetical protein
MLNTRYYTHKLYFFRDRSDTKRVLFDALNMLN